MAYIIKGTRILLGTFVTIAILLENPDEGRSALLAAFDEIHRINGLMSVHNETSEVSQLNKNGFCESISSDTKQVIERAGYFSKLSDGAFDITILPVLELWEESAHVGKLPTDMEIADRTNLVNHEDILIKDTRVQFKKSGMGITTAGIGKGYAVDKAIEALQRHGIEHALVNAGGDLRVIGGKTRSIPWKIAVRDPRNRDHIATTFQLYDQAMATSGSYQRRFNDIIDPRSGKPAQGIISSTVIAETAMDADILATCLYVLGRKKGTEFVGKIKGTRAFVITEDGSPSN